MAAATAAIIASIIGSAAASAGTSIYGAKKQSDAATEASKTQAEAATHAGQVTQAAAERGVNNLASVTPAANEIVGDASQQSIDQLVASRGRNELALSPYTSAGSRAASGMLDLANGPAFSFTGKDVATDPGYQFALEQGQKALERSAAARGGAFGGAALKMTDRYATDYASTKFNDAFSRALDTYKTNASTKLAALNPLLSAGVDASGRQVASDTTLTSQASDLNSRRGTWQGSNLMAGASAANDLIMRGAEGEGNALTGAANARAAGTVGSANAWANGLAGASGAGSQTALLLSLLSMGRKKLPDAGNNVDPGAYQGGG